MAKKKKVTLDEFHYHEVLDRLSVIMGGLNEHVLEHPVVEKHKDVQQLVEDGMSKLWDAYQLVGRIDYDLWKGEYGA